MCDNDSSRDIAKKRLINLLTMDRQDSAGKVLDMLKPDMAGVISQYLDIEADKLTISIKRADDNLSSVLVASVPLC